MLHVTETAILVYSCLLAISYRASPHPIPYPYTIPYKPALLLLMRRRLGVFMYCCMGATKKRGVFVVVHKNFDFSGNILVHFGIAIKALPTYSIKALFFVGILICVNLLL